MFGGQLGFPELALIVVIVLIVFGAGKLPEVGGAMGKAIREFRKASKGEEDEPAKPKSSSQSEAAEASKGK